MKKLAKALLMVACAWLLMVETGGMVLSATWVKLKKENQDEAADMLDIYTRELWCKPIVFVFETLKQKFLEIFEKEG